MVMELGGDNLHSVIEKLHIAKVQQSRLRSGDYIRAVDKKQIWRQIVNVMTTLHANNIVHMDLKPHNLILFGHTLKICDLGISKKGDVLGSAGVGTPYFR